MFKGKANFNSTKSVNANHSILSGSLKLSFFYLLIVVIAAQSLFAQNNISRSEIRYETQEESKTAIPVKTVKKNNENLVPLTASFTEGFDDATYPAGWSFQNLSTTIGTNTNCWNIFPGATPWPPQAGTGHIGANFNCTTGNNTISGWLFSPVITFQNGDQIKFWTRKASPDSFPDRLELRLSTNGASTDAGTTSSSVGDFTTLLVSVNPTLVTGVYPTTYTQYSATLSGLPGATSGRVAFRYYVTSGGPSGANSDIISIDTFQYVNVIPTAAHATVGGYVTSSNGQGVPRATVQMIDQNGNLRTTKTNTFGYYSFEDVPVGQNYVFNVFAKSYLFNSQIANVLENVDGLNFVAQE